MLLPYRYRSTAMEPRSLIRINNADDAKSFD